MKNYIGFVNDHSGSMSSLARAAAADYNATITAIKEAASREMLDTVVSVVGIGLADGRNGRGTGVLRQVQISNPHVLKPIDAWETPGGTPLWDGVGNMIELLESLPDANNEDVSFLVSTTTDGEEYHSSIYTKAALAMKIAEKQRTGRWTFVFRVPKGARGMIDGLGVPQDNIVEWETTQAGMAKSTAQTTQAVNAFYSARSAGAKSSNVFYTNTAAVDTSKLADISSEVSLYIVGDSQDGIHIRDFILTKRMEFLIGAAFYQLTKTGARVSPSKLILIRDRQTGQVFAGKDARQMLGLDTLNNARIHPNHGNGNYDIFIQSESVNRKLVKGTGVLYWAKQGRPVTKADLDKYAKPAAPAVPVLPAAPATGKPTPSPIAPTPKLAVQATMVNGKLVKWYKNREDCRHNARLDGKFQKDGNDFGNARGPNGERWFYFI